MGLDAGELAALADEGSTHPKEIEMDGTKPWYTSQAVWASMMTMLTGLLVTFGMMTQDMAVAVVGEVPGYMVGLALSLTGLWSLWGRFKATMKIG